MNIHEQNEAILFQIHFHEDFGRLVHKQNKVEVYLRRPHKFDEITLLLIDVTTAGILECVP